MRSNVQVHPSVQLSALTTRSRAAGKPQHLGGGVAANRIPAVVQLIFRHI